MLQIVFSFKTNHYKKKNNRRSENGMDKGKKGTNIKSYLILVWPPVSTCSTNNVRNRNQQIIRSNC